MKIVSEASVIALIAFLIMAAGRSAVAADQTPQKPHHQSTETHTRRAAPSFGRQPGHQSGGHRGEEQGRFGHPGAPVLPGVPAAAVPAIIGGIIGGVLRQAQPAAPSSTWYYCDASGRYYPYVASCASGWRPVRPQ